MIYFIGFNLEGFHTPTIQVLYDMKQLGFCHGVVDNLHCDRRIYVVGFML